MNNLVMSAEPKRTEPFVSERMAEIFNEVSTVCIPRGLYFFKVKLSWDNTKAFDLETIEEIEQAKWRYRAVGLHPEVRYLRWGRDCLLFTDDSSFFRGQYTGDIREKSPGYCGYRISCKRQGLCGNYKATVAFGSDYLAHRKEKALRFARETSVSKVADDIRSLLHVHTPEVHVQVEEVFEAVNQERQAVGLELVTPAQAGLEGGLLLMLDPN